MKTTRPTLLRHRWGFLAVSLLAILVLVVPAAPAQVSYEMLLEASEHPDDWLMHSGQYNSQRFSKLDQVDSTTMGLIWQADSQMLAGIRQTASADTLSRVSGSLLCTRSDNDTGNNPHNPMYGIAMAGADGELVSHQIAQAPAVENRVGDPAQARDEQQKGQEVKRTEEGQ